MRDVPMFMNGYWVTWEFDTLEGLSRFFEVEFLEKMTEKVIRRTFYNQYPSKMTKVASQKPDTKKLGRDIFTFIDQINRMQRILLEVEPAGLQVVLYKPR